MKMIMELFLMSTIVFSDGQLWIVSREFYKISKAPKCKIALNLGSEDRNLAPNWNLPSPKIARNITRALPGFGCTRKFLRPNSAQIKNPSTRFLPELDFARIPFRSFLPKLKRVCSFPTLPKPSDQWPGFVESYSRNVLKTSECSLNSNSLSHHYYQQWGLRIKSFLSLCQKTNFVISSLPK